MNFFKNMKKRLFLYGFLVLLAAGVFYYRPYLENLYLSSAEKVQDLGLLPNVQLAVSEQKKISAPPPLRAEKESPKAYLTRKGVFDLTNEEREKDGQKPLKENSKLDAAAEKKASDILAKQYFDHVNPDGKGPDYFVSSAGYDYIIIGENLALGNFADDQALIDAWMASPGHRENILQPKFREIGIAVIKGTYEGKPAWVAVQEFGTPLSVCDAPDADLKKDIEKNQSKIEEMAQDLSTQKLEMKNVSPRDPAYNQMADDYNMKVEKYNSLIVDTKKMVKKYNSQVQGYKDCMESFQ